MKRTVLVFLITIAALTLPIRVQAESVAGHSAQLISSNNRDLANGQIQQAKYAKRLAIKHLMEKYDSPMTGSLDTFMTVAEKYDLDPFLLPSIAVLESTFGNAILPSSHNPFGWGGGYMMFNTWDDAIEAVGKGLRENYLNKGAEGIYGIAPIYSESPTWAPRVNSVHSKLEEDAAKIQLYLGSNSVQL